MFILFYFFFNASESPQHHYLAKHKYCIDDHLWIITSNYYFLLTYQKIGTLIDAGLVLLIMAPLFTVYIKCIKNYHKDFYNQSTSTEINSSVMTEMPNFLLTTT